MAVGGSNILTGVEEEGENKSFYPASQVKGVLKTQRVRPGRKGSIIMDILTVYRPSRFHKDSFQTTKLSAFLCEDFKHITS